MKEIIKKLLRNTGRTIKPIDTYSEQLDLVKDKWLEKQNIQTIFDIGAGDGGFAKKIRRLFPLATIYSFEALPDVYEKLKMNFRDDKLFHAYNIALSNFTGRTTFFRCESTGSSSILEMDELHKIAYPATANNELIKIDCFKLDEFIINRHIAVGQNVLLKLDVQGAEKLVFEGALDLIKKTSVIFSEINFNTTYKGNVLFNELSAFLYENGFKIEGIENISQSLVDGTFLQADAYFTRLNSL